MTSDSQRLPRDADHSEHFDVIGLTLPRLLNPALAAAVARAGGIGVIDLAWGIEEPWRDAAENGSGARMAIETLARLARGRWGVRLDPEESTWEMLAGILRCGFELAILTWAPREILEREIAKLRQAEYGPRRILVEIASAADLSTVDGLASIDGVIAKGHESGGMVGDETAFILVQSCLQRTTLPVWVQGGIGLHSAAACRAAGAVGVVVDAQLCLAQESTLPDPVRRRAAHMDGADTVTAGDASIGIFRCCAHPASGAVNALQAAARDLVDSGAASRKAWKDACRERVGWGDPQRWAWPLGQDAVFAAQFAERFHTAGRMIQAICESAEEHLTEAALHHPFAEGSPLSHSHGTRYPIVQGPMTRVSDNAPFALAVAEAGALPFVALALSSAEETRRVLSETRIALEERPWGVGILGFVPLSVRTAQLNVIREVKPSFALIAGGRPDQALSLERDGIPTYLHTPSQELLRQFFEQGARHFVFEGRECGGHVGPRCSFVLWDGMIETLLSLKQKGAAIDDVQILFAGGIHDGMSAAMAGCMAAPLLRAGVKIGVLLGTAYLFTREAVETGAIGSVYQEEALRCRSTALLESGPGHATRCAPTAFVQRFESERRGMAVSGVSAEEMRNRLEELNLGRLRLASKGLIRYPPVGVDASVTKPKKVDSEQQRADGMYMMGQLAALREEVCSIASLHEEISDGSSVRLRSRRPNRVWRVEPRPCNVAIVGISTMLPGARNVQQYWENILARVDAITEIPAHRFDWQKYYDPNPAAPDKIYSKWGGFLDDLPFNPTDYGMPPHVLSSIEPMQLLTLEAVRMAMADAGYADRPYSRARTSVILGAGGGLADLGQQYGTRSILPALANGDGEISPEWLKRLPEWTEDSFAGLLLNVVAGRVTNRFDFGGVNFTVDAACASSLASVYSAVRELESGSSDLVIAGGVDTVQNPFGYMCFSKTRALSPRGRCRSFDAGADGIAISEGLVVLVLKRLSDAERDGDRIYAVIKSIAGSSDGRDKGLTAPRPEGQAVALRRAYETAGINPASVGLIEAHGTGTVAGDLAEVEALKTVFAGSPHQSCAIGSVKSMIGHTKCAAGAAGLVKAALALHEKVLPPTLHVEAPNPKADFPNSPFFLNTEARPWFAPQSGEPRRAGVSAFGFGGTNFHVVLEQYLHDPIADVRAPVARNWPSELLVWTAESPDELAEQLAQLSGELDRGAQPALVDLAQATWRRCRPEHETRLGITADGCSDLRDKLRLVIEALSRRDTDHFTDPRGIELRLRSRTPDGKIAFLFPGQGSQHVDMLAELALYFPEVRGAFEEADRLLGERFPDRITSFIFPPSQFTQEERAQFKKKLSQTEITQPALGAACLAMLDLIQTLGLRADVLAGHSYGEYVALSAAGVFSRPELYALSAARGRYMADVAEPGTMLAAWESEERVRSTTAGTQDIWIANVNSPRQTVLSGTYEGIQVAKQRLTDAGIEVSAIPVSCAFHSPLVAGAKDRLAVDLKSARPASPRIPVYSNMTGKPYADDPGAVAELLAEHLIHPVRFMDEVEAMYRSGVRTFLEVGPRGVLTGLVGQVLGNNAHLAVAMGDEHAPLKHLHQVLARLFVERIPVSLERLYQYRAAGAADLQTVLERSGPRDLPPGVWLVNGGRARRLGEPAMPREALRVADAPEKPAFELEAGAAPALACETDAVMVRFQETMAHFLETQRSTMIAYLGGANGSANGKLPQLTSANAEILTCAERTKPETPAPASVMEALAVSPCPVLTIRERLCTIISDRTGYPIDMLRAECNLESDLGIDSIKRVEILGAFQRSCSGEDQLRIRPLMEKLTSLRTIGSLTNELEAIFAVSQAVDDVTVLAASESSPARVDGDSAAEALPRFVLGVTRAPALPRGSATLPAGRVLITDDGGGIASAVARELETLGWPVILIGAPDLQMPSSAPSPGTRFMRDLADEFAMAEFAQQIRGECGPIAAVLHLLPLTDAQRLSWNRRFALETKGLFNLARSFSRDLRAHGEARPLLLAATCLGGSFGVAGISEDASPVQGGVAGLVKTLALEWLDVNCRIVDLEAGMEPQAATELLLDAVFTAGPVESGYRGGTKVQLQVSPAPLDSMEQVPLLVPDPVILVTGGARGITAKATIALARHCGGRIFLIGKSPLPAGKESPQTASIESAQRLRSALIDQARRSGIAPDPRSIEASVTQILHDREIRANLEALRSTGAIVEYRPCDLARDDEFGRLIDEIYASCGAIHGVIHGAGIIEDRLFENKDLSSFSRVCAPKIAAAMVLAERLRTESLQFLAFFSSVSGRFGNRGQADYAAANEVLNKLAAQLDGRWPARVVAINWGPWEGSGMVNDAVRGQFVQRKVQLIDPASGCAAFLRELATGKKGEPEVILGGGPWAAVARPVASPVEGALPLIDAKALAGASTEKVSLTLTLDPEEHRYLADHCLDGRAVLPAAMAVEMMAEVARNGWPDLAVTGVRSARVCKGIVLDRIGRRLRVTATPQTHYSAEDLSLRIDVEIADGDSPGPVFYRGTVCMAQEVPVAPPISRASAPRFGVSLTASEIYSERLFHRGPFQVLQKVIAISEEGVWALVRPSTPAACLRRSEGAWIIDPLLLDAGPQMAILWAQEMRGATALPSRFGEIRIFDGACALAAGVDEPLTCCLLVAPSDGGPIFTSTYQVFGPDGGLVLLAEELESTASTSLNRLAPGMVAAD